MRGAAIAPLPASKGKNMGARRINAKKKIKRRAHSANRRAQEKADGLKPVAERDRNASRPPRSTTGR
jgi:hypothetical protein